MSFPIENPLAVSSFLSLNSPLLSRSGSRNRDRRRWVPSSAVLPKCLFVFLSSYWGFSWVSQMQFTQCLSVWFAPWKKWEVHCGHPSGAAQLWCCSLGCRAGAEQPGHDGLCVLQSVSPWMSSRPLSINTWYTSIVLMSEVSVIIYNNSDVKIELRLKHPHLWEELALMLWQHSLWSWTWRSPSLLLSFGIFLIFRAGWNKSASKVQDFHKEDSLRIMIISQATSFGLSSTYTGLTCEWCRFVNSALALATCLQ